MRTLLSLLALVAASSPVLAAPDVVVSTKPLHSLVAAVMNGVAEPSLIVKGSASPHTYALRPSDAAALEQADVVFWTGPGMEVFLTDALATLSGNATVVELADTPGLALLPVREGGAFEPHADDEAHEHAEDGHDHDHDHDHDTADMHFWLDPDNAKLMVGEIAKTLGKLDPDNATTYANNAEVELLALGALDNEIAVTLIGVKDKPFIVFHDAYQYFERHFGLALAGSITVSPETMPGAARVDELRRKVGELGATCVFAEPNFEPAIVRTIVEGTEAKSGTLDPEGSALAEGPDLYAQLLRNLAGSIKDCLSPSAAAP